MPEAAGFDPARLRAAFAGRRVLLTGHSGFKGGWLAPAGEVSEPLQSDPRAASAREIGVAESRAASAAADAQQQATPPRNQPPQ